MDTITVDVPLSVAEIKLAINGLGWLISETAGLHEDAKGLIDKLEGYIQED